MYTFLDFSTLFSKNGLPNSYFEHRIVIFVQKISYFPFLLFNYCRKDREEKCSDQNFYVAGDNKDCVPVIGNIGLTNLWKSHLCKFHSVTLDTAEAILKEYPNSSKLIRVSFKCTTLIFAIIPTKF